MDKALEGVLGVERLGLWFDGRTGRLGVTTAPLIHDGSLGLFLLGRSSVTRLSLQMFGGREVHSLHSRRCLFSYYSEFWAQVGSGRSQIFLKAATKREMLPALGAMPMRFTNLRAQFSGDVAVPDASLVGGGVIVSCGLTATGFAAAEGGRTPNGTTGNCP